MKDTAKPDQQMVRQVLEQCEREQALVETNQLTVNKPRIWKHAAVGCGLGAIIVPAITCVLFVLIYDLNDIDTPIALFVQFVVLMAGAISLGALIGAMAGPIIMAIVRKLKGH